jgi:putative thiamine transport system permease protein
MLQKPAIIILLCVSVIPTSAGVLAALWSGLDSAALTRVLATPGVGLSIASSIWSGIIATGVSLLLAHLAVALAASGGWRKRLNGFALPLLAMPHLAMGIGLALLLAPSGVLLRAVSPWATGFDLPPDWLIVQDPAALSLILGLVLKETCFLIMALMAALAQVPSAELQLQARALGYGPLKAWLAVTAPLLQRQIRLPLAAVLVFGIGNVELAIPLGPGLPPTFSVMLWRWFTNPDPLINAQAYAGTVLLLLATTATLAFMAAANTLLSRLLRRAAESGRRRSHDGLARGVARSVLVVGWLTGILAIAAILLRSAAGPWRFPALLPGGDWLARWLDVLPVAGNVAATTIGLAVATALCGLLLVLPAAEQCRRDRRTQAIVGAWLFVPLLVPQMTFLFGIQVLLVRLHLDGQTVAVLWSHLIFALPYLWGLLAPARATIDPRYQSVAATLGATPLRTWFTVTAPLLARSTLLAFALAFSVSVSLYLPTLFAGAGRFATAATEAAASAGSGNLRLASVHGLLLAVLPLTVFALAYTTNSLLFRNRRGVPQ